MTTKQPSELLYDSEATLRLVDSAIQDMGDIGAEDDAPAEPGVRVAMPPSTTGASAALARSALLVHGYAEILGVLDSIRQSRGFLEHSTIDTPQLQLPDIMRQQLDYATSVLNDVEARLAQIARTIDPKALGAAPGEPGGPAFRR